METTVKIVLGFVMMMSMAMANKDLENMVKGLVVEMKEMNAMTQTELKNAATADILIAQYLTHFLYSTSLSPALSS